MEALGDGWDVQHPAGERRERRRTIDRDGDVRPHQRERDERARPLPVQRQRGLRRLERDVSALVVKADPIEDETRTVGVQRREFEIARTRHHEQRGGGGAVDRFANEPRDREQEDDERTCDRQRPMPGSGAPKNAPGIGGRHCKSSVSMILQGPLKTCVVVVLLLAGVASAQAPLPYVAVLVWHDVVANEKEVWFDTTLATFRRQLAAIASGGFHVVTLDALRAHLEHGAPLPNRPLVLTFDDNGAGIY